MRIQWHALRQDFCRAQRLCGACNLHVPGSGVVFVRRRMRGQAVCQSMRGFIPTLSSDCEESADIDESSSEVCPEGRGSVEFRRELLRQQAGASVLEVHRRADCA